MPFWTEEGVCVPAVTTEQMREVDRIAVEKFGLTILQMMENAGRSLAENILDMLDDERGEVAILVGGGGKGGGGLCCARHSLTLEPLFSMGYWLPLTLDETTDRSGDTIPQIRKETHSDGQ